MNLCLPKYSTLLAALACLVAALPAQEGEVQSQLEAKRNKLAQKRAAQLRGEDGEIGDMTPEERLAASKRRGSRGQCQFVAAVRPPKLLPGQSGTMLITAILQGRSVLPAPSQVSLTAQPNPMVQVGGLTARPAPIGALHEAYRGQPVYENTAIFEVPVTVTQSAKLGDKAQVSVDLEFDIYDGRTAQAVGRFIERVNAEVEIAPHLDPDVEGRQMRAPDVVPVAPKTARPDELDAPAPAADNKPEALGGNAGEVAADAPRADAGEPAAPAADELPLSAAGSGGSNMLIFGGGAIVLVLLALLLMRKK